MFKRLLFLGRAALISAAIAFPAAVAAQGEQQQLVDRAQSTLNNFLRDPEMTWLQKNLPRARGVLIAPEIVKAGFIIGGSGGRAVVVARDAATGKWRGPGFYTLATASIGFQAGVAASEIVTLVMTEKGVNSLLSSSFKMGADASVAAGPVGAGASGNVAADFITFARSKGVYGGLNLGGTVINISEEWNRAYYAQGALAPDILVRGTAVNAKADNLLTAVAKATSAQ